MHRTTCKMPGWMKHKLESRSWGEISTTSGMTTLIAESKEELKSLLMRVKEESEKADLELNIQKCKIMVSGPITSQLMLCCAKSLQSFPTLCDPIDCSPPGSSVHGILQARILEWVALLQGIFPYREWNPCPLH